VKRWLRKRVVGGEGKTAEIDSGYFDGYVKPANRKEDRLDRRFTRNQNGKRKVVVIVRERGGNSVPAVFSSDSRAAAFIKQRIAKAPPFTPTKAAHVSRLIPSLNHRLPDAGHWFISFCCLTSECPNSNSP
jgi:hypothetical protein